MRRALVALALVSVAGFAGADPALDAEEREFLRLINEYRAGFGLPCLSPSPTAAIAADWFSREMGEQGFFSHNEPPCDESGRNCTGRDPFERMEFFGHVGWTTAGENIAAGYVTAADVFEGWRNSPGHDENMRRPGFTAIGIGRVEVPGSEYRIYWTTDFSNLVDGPEDCNDPGTGGAGGTGGVGGSGGGVGGSGGGEGGWGGTGGVGGTGGAGGIGGTGAIGGAGGLGGRAGGPAGGDDGSGADGDGDGDGDGGWGCTAGPGAATPLALALIALVSFRRRRPW